MGVPSLFGKWSKKKEKDTDAQEEIYLVEEKDRRILANVPDPLVQRKLGTRRGLKEALPKGVDFEAEMLDDYGFVAKLNKAGKRYMGSFPVSAYSLKRDEGLLFNGTSINISISGLLMFVAESTFNKELGDMIELRFFVYPGLMPEGIESDVKIKSRIVNIKKDETEPGMLKVAVEFEKNLEKYLTRKRWRIFETVSILFLFIIILTIFLMRVESVEYFFFDVPLYTYSIMTSIFLISRYLFSAFYKNVPIDPNFNPGVTIIIPCFNEEQWISRTIRSCMDQHYEPEKLEVIVVDDGSSDLSLERIEQEISDLITYGARFNVNGRITLVYPEKNEGKRHALMKGVELAKHELIAFVDSDSFLDPMAIRHLVQPFRNPKMGGVTGRTDVENKWTNYLTKMQTVRYYISFRIFKAAESVFDAVTCLSGPLSLYRKELILTHKDAWLNQRFLFHPATFGDDRSLTNFILPKYRTVYQDQAICSTMVPSSFKVFMKQQMRWKRSWLRESLRAGSFMWRKEPLMAISFYMGLVIPIAAPFIVLRNLVYVPLVRGVFPSTYLMGLLLMSLLMSSVYLLIKKSGLWVYGGIFCVFYVFVLLWQMPIAFVTFWKSSWGTRPTANDVAEEEKRKGKCAPRRRV